MITKLVFYSCLFLQFIFSNRTMAQVSTACYGSSYLICTEHRLTCTEPLVISVTNITFGYRRGCSIVGLASCPGDTTCCREEIGDCFTPYNQTLLSQLQQTCNGRSTCTLNDNTGLNEHSSFCAFGIPIKHSYSRIEYMCSAITTPPTPQPKTETTSSTTTQTIASNQASTDLTNTQELPTPAPDSTTTGLVLATENERVTYTDEGTTNVGGIVGGIVGVIIVIAIVGAVIFLIKRRLKKLKSQNENQYDSTPSRIIDQPTQHTDERAQYINEQQLSVTTNGQTSTNYVTQDYEHAYDSAPSVITNGPKAVYDSLNTREQTGYYNMGNITDDNQLSTTNNGRSPITTNNPDYEHAYSALDHDTNKPKAVYDSLNTREQTGYYNMGSINTTDDSQQQGTANRT